MSDQHPLPDDLARPRPSRGLWVGVWLGAAMLALDIALLAYALSLP